MSSSCEACQRGPSSGEPDVRNDEDNDLDESPEKRHPAAHVSLFSFLPPRQTLNSRGHTKSTRGVDGSEREANDGARYQTDKGRRRGHGDGNEKVKP